MGRDLAIVGRISLAVLLILGGATRALAQVGSGQVTGVVTDAAGAAVPGATITATNLATGVPRRTVSSSAGVFSMPGLLPGTYRLDIELTGFKPARRDDVRIEAGRTLRIDVPLAVGELSEAVTVQGEAPELRATASLGQVVSQEKVTGLPLNGRTFITLAALAPGVALPPGSQLPRINGGRPRTNEYLYDGVSVLQPEPGQVAYFPVIDAYPGIQNRDEQPAGGVRPVQRRRHQPHAALRHERAPRIRLRVLS